ncbi:transglycosylase SLT domain-containing protein [Tropicibacter sp. Alg240-R139]|uniref:transglycosylase SLT domain-containing protein n=1 Tax=Tropicibacter sp. Alg240-R139 TaxID=2305991 RepID=UPI002795FCA4|nr:transglycosylase SLT domain-containing protein [Tropicibacter sp. Alg240-R139]
MPQPLHSRPWNWLRFAGRNQGQTALFLALIMVSPAPALANALPQTRTTGNLCDRAALRAARTHGIPEDVMLAITRVETGRTAQGRTSSWPWTVNMEGAGHWFTTEDEARSYVFSRFKDGARSFDVGCFQINYKWHSSGFKSIDEMFDPDLNATYAARFLETLHDEFGDWSKAAGAYHSRTRQYADIYIARFDAARADLNGDAPSIDIGPMPILGHASRQPLIGSGDVGMGSLVPTGAKSNSLSLIVFN